MTMKPSAPKIVVGYKTRPADLKTSFTPEFAAPANYKDQVKIAEYIDQKRAEWSQTLLTYPYLSTLDDVFIAVIAPGVRDVGQWHYRAPERGKQSLSLAVRSFLMKHFGAAWEDGTGPQPIFIGFDLRVFLKIWGLECSMPVNANPLPPRVWYGTTMHRDIGDALLPAEYKAVPLAQVLAWRGIDTQGWERPGVDVERDARIAVTAADQLGFLSESE